MRFQFGFCSAFWHTPLDNEQRAFILSVCHKEIKTPCDSSITLTIWAGTFFFFTISDEIIGLRAVRLNAPTTSNRDGQLSGRLCDSRSAVQLVSQRDGQTSGPADRWVRQPTCRSASVSASDQCISSVSTAESGPTVSGRIRSTGRV